MRNNNGGVRRRDGKRDDYRRNGSADGRGGCGSRDFSTERVANEGWKTLRVCVNRECGAERDQSARGVREGWHMEASVLRRRRGDVSVGQSGRGARRRHDVIVLERRVSEQSKAVLREVGKLS